MGEKEREEEARGTLPTTTTEIRGMIWSWCVCDGHCQELLYATKPLGVSTCSQEERTKCDSL